MSEELKPCPFCGSHRIKREPWVIQCQNCNATYYGQPDNPPDVILEGWNCRAVNEWPDAADERIWNAALEKAAKFCEKKAHNYLNSKRYPTFWLDGMQQSALECAEEIRVLKKPPRS